MKYVVLLRGINISGKNKIAMSELKEVLESNGYLNVKTYLNSGNIVLETNSSKEAIVENIHLSILNKFNLDIPVFVIPFEELLEIYAKIPCPLIEENVKLYENIIFIMPPTTIKEVFDTLGDVGEDVAYEIDSAIYWAYDLNNYRKSNWWKNTALSPIKDKITIRTLGTIKKILEIK